MHVDRIPGRQRDVPAAAPFRHLSTVALRGRPEHCRRADAESRRTARPQPIPRQPYRKAPLPRWKYKCCRGEDAQCRTLASSEVQELPVYLPRCVPRERRRHWRCASLFFGWALPEQRRTKPCTRPPSPAPAHCRDPMMRLTWSVSILQYQAVLFGDDGAQLQQLHAGGATRGRGRSVSCIRVLSTPGDACSSIRMMRSPEETAPSSMLVGDEG